MSAILQLNGFRVLNEPKFAENGRCVLHLLSETESDGCALKFFVSTFDRERIERLKIKKGSFVDAICEPHPYISKEGKPEIGYSLIYITYNQFQAKAKKEEPKNKEEKEEMELRKVAEMLLTNPFA